MQYGRDQHPLPDCRFSAIFTGFPPRLVGAADEHADPIFEVEFDTN